MTSTLSADRAWRTRGEFLAARAEAVPALEERLFAAGRTGGQVLLMVIVAVAGLAATFAAEQGGSPAVPVAAAMVGLAAAAASIRPALRNRAPSGPGRRALMLAPVALPLLVFLGFRLAHSSQTAVLVVAGVLVVAALVTAVLLLVRRGRGAQTG